MSEINWHGRASTRATPEDFRKNFRTEHIDQGGRSPVPGFPVLGLEEGDKAAAGAKGSEPCVAFLSWQVQEQAWGPVGADRR